MERKIKSITAHGMTFNVTKVLYFGEYGDDSVYIRNDELKADYEILLDDEKYEVLFPRPMEDE